MPFEALQRAEMDASKDLKLPLYWPAPATETAVEAGAVEVGALDESVYQTMLKDAKLDGAEVRVFFTTLSVVDYVWVARKQVDVSERDKFGVAFLALRGSRRHCHRAMVPTALVSLREDAIAGAGLRPDWRRLDFVSDAVTGGEKCWGAQENKPAPLSEWQPA
jgi:hypothetical protein